MTNEGQPPDLQTRTEGEGEGDTLDMPEGRAEVAEW